MGNYGFSTTIPYGTDSFEVTGIEYCAWEDALEAIAEGDTNAMDWATYDILMDNGYLVAQPLSPRPVERLEDAVEMAAETRPRNPGAGSHASVLDNLVSGASREPIWTQSRILSERSKLVTEREKIQAIKEKGLAQRILEQQILQRRIVEEQTAPPNYDGFYAVMGFVFLGFILLMGIAMAVS